MTCTRYTKAPTSRGKFLGGKSLTMSPTQVAAVYHGFTTENTAILMKGFVLISINNGKDCDACLSLKMEEGSNSHLKPYTMPEGKR